jgi:predicted nucleic acid-binding protein
MSDRLFLDTNILVYCYDKHETQKQRKAQELLTDGIEQENLFLSVQVLGEFFNVVTRRIPQPMTPDEAKEIINTLSILPVQEIDLTMVNRAIDTHKSVSNFVLGCLNCFSGRASRMHDDPFRRFKRWSNLSQNPGEQSFQ